MANMGGPENFKFEKDQRITSTKKFSKEKKRQFFCVECFVHAKMAKGGILAFGPPKSGKTTFCKYFALEAIKTPGHVVYVTVDEPPEDVEQFFKEILSDRNHNEKITIVDGYSWRTGLPPSGNYSVINPKNLSDLSITIDKLAKVSENQHFILDSLSSIILDAGPEPTRTFLQILLARMNSYNTLFLATLGEGIHKEDYEQTMRFMFDGILEFKVQEEEDEMNRFIRIYVMKGAKHTTAWHRYEIGESGFEFPESSSIQHGINHIKRILARSYY